MYKSIIFSWLIIASSAHAGDVWLESELSLRAPSEALHKAGLDSPLFGVAIVYEPHSSEGRWGLYARHTSSIPNTHDGAGLNEVGIRGRIKLD